MATLHLISGLPCSGKTTYAAELHAEVQGVLYCLDRWLITAFGRYTLASVGLEEHTRRVLACRELIWGSAAEFLRRSVDVILDDGFFYREHRMRHVALAADTGGGTTTHFIDTPLDVVQRRLERRNADLPRYNFHVDPTILDTFLTMFERPSLDEGADLVIVSAAASAGENAARPARP
jgi:predicted kinase